MAPDTLLVKNAFPLRLLIAQRNDVLCIGPISFRVVSCQKRISFGCFVMLAASRDAAERHQKESADPNTRFHRAAPCVKKCDPLMLAVFCGLMLCRIVIRYAVKAMTSSSVKFRRGSMVLGMSACGFLSHASIHAAVSQPPALFRLGPTYPPVLPMVWHAWH